MRLDGRLKGDVRESREPIIIIIGMDMDSQQLNRKMHTQQLGFFRADDGSNSIIETIHLTERVKNINHTIYHIDRTRISNRSE